MLLSLLLIGWCNAASLWPKAHTAGVFEDLHPLVFKKGQLALVLLHNVSSSDGDIYISFLKSQCCFHPHNCWQKSSNYCTVSHFK